MFYDIKIGSQRNASKRRSLFSLSAALSFRLAQRAKKEKSLRPLLKRHRFSPHAERKYTHIKPAAVFSLVRGASERERGRGAIIRGGRL
jgi:hypothetical protein